MPTIRNSHHPLNGFFFLVQLNPLILIYIKAKRVEIIFIYGSTNRFASINPQAFNELRPHKNVGTNYWRNLLAEF